MTEQARGTYTERFGVRPATTLRSGAGTAVR